MRMTLLTAIAFFGINSFAGECYETERVEGFPGIVKQQIDAEMSDPIQVNGCSLSIAVDGGVSATERASSQIQFYRAYDLGEGPSCYYLTESSVKPRLISCKKEV